MLLQIGKKKITEPEDVFDASFYITAGDVVPITVMRGDRENDFPCAGGDASGQQDRYVARLSGHNPRGNSHVARRRRFALAVGRKWFFVESPQLIGRTATRLRTSSESGENENCLPCSNL